MKIKGKKVKKVELKKSVKFTEELACLIELHKLQGALLENMKKAVGM